MTTDYLQLMLEKQTKLDETIYDNHGKIIELQKIGYLDNDDTMKVATAHQLLEETWEYIRTFPKRKYFNDSLQVIDIEKREEELIDMFFFILKELNNHCLTSEDVFILYCNKLKKNMKRQEDKHY